MADEPVVHIGENSPEQVAWKLYNLIAGKEGSRTTKDDILGLYAECLETVKNHYTRLPKG